MLISLSQAERLYCRSQLSSQLLSSVWHLCPNNIYYKNKMIKLEFHGAAQTVTGSNYLVDVNGKKFLIDCGMFQGPDVEHKNLEEYSYNPKEIDFVLLTHAHIDHCGMLPKLFRGGFRGKIYSTVHSFQIASLLLMDSGKIQENNFSSGMPFGKYTNTVGMAYNTFDAEQTISLFETVRMNEVKEIIEGVKVKFITAGHILGAASIEVEVNDGEKTRTILFSGDIGRVKSTLIPSFDPSYRSEPDYILVESLYGGQIHPNRQENIDEIIKIIQDTIERGGNVYIPAFSVQRTQEVLHDMKVAQDEGKLDKELPVWLDSPLSQKVSYVYLTALSQTPETSFMFDSMKFVKQYRQSLQLDRKAGQVVIAGSGMADGGRIVQHLEASLSNPKHSIVFVGYQADGTLGREIVDGAKTVTIGKSKVNVKSKIYFFGGFSAHGDDSDYRAWIKRHTGNNLKKVFLVHSYLDRANAFNKSLDSMGITQTHIPAIGETVELE